MRAPEAVRAGPSLRRRLTLAAAAAVAVAIALAAAITFVLVRGELRGQVDDSLRETAGELSDRALVFGEGPAGPGPPAIPPGGGPGARHGDDLPPRRPGEAIEPRLLPTPGMERRLVLPAPPLGSAVRYAQIVGADGSVVRSPQVTFDLPGTPGAATLARRGSGSYFSDADVRGVRLRVYTTALARGAALQVARPVEELDGVLRRLGGVLAAVSLAGVGLAAALALLVARAALKPVGELSAAAEHVARTRDLSRRIDSASPDELGRLAASFNTMLEALERSMRQQRQLVADASHELRTPLTSLRTNVEVLAQADGLAEADRRRLVRDVVGQLEELTVLVGDLVELARDGEEEQLEEDVRLEEIVADAVERARRRHPEREFELDLQPTVVRGAAARLDRAVTNLLDNAAKWSPPGAPVEVAVGDGEVVVRDHGPGIADEDLPFVFDRFYRAPSARASPGSGLGLAIVRQVAEAHRGQVHAERAGGGGACLRLRLPVSDAAQPGADR